MRSVVGRVLSIFNLLRQSHIYYKAVDLGRVLFIFKEGLMIVSYVEFSADSEYAILTQICLSVNLSSPIFKMAVVKR